MKLGPVDDGFLIVLQVQSYLDIVRHDRREVNLANFDDISYEGTTNAQIKGTLANNYRQSSVCELYQYILALYLPSILGDGLNVLYLDLDF